MTFWSIKSQVLQNNENKAFKTSCHFPVKNHLNLNKNCLNKNRLNKNRLNKNRLKAFKLKNIDIENQGMMQQPFRST